MEDKEALEACALVSKLSNTVKNKIDHFLSNCVVTTCVVVGSILLASDQLLRVEELAIGACTHLIYKGKNIAR